MNSKKICPKCKSEYPEDAMFCKDCGTALETISSQNPEENNAPQPVSPQSNPPRKKLSKGQIIAIVVAAAIVLLFIGSRLGRSADKIETTESPITVTETTTEYTTEAPAETTTTTTKASTIPITSTVPAKSYVDLEGIHAYYTQRIDVYPTDMGGSDSEYELVKVFFQTRDTDYDGLMMRVSDSYGGEEYYELPKGTTDAYYVNGGEDYKIEVRTFRGDPNIIHCIWSDWTTVSSTSLLSKWETRTVNSDEFADERSRMESNDYLIIGP